MSRERTVYFMRPVGQHGPVKIGSSYSPKHRLAVYLTWSPLPLEIVAEITGHRSLEARFHAKFAADRSHHEWFNWSADLEATIEAIASGDFDPDSLPDPRHISLGNRDREARQASADNHRVTSLLKRGEAVPPHIVAACDQFGLPPHEKATKRAIVRAFIAARFGGQTELAA